MWWLARAPYEATGRVAEWCARFAPAHPRSKLGATFAGRRHILDRYRRWGETSRDRRRPLLWMHAPSVGEGLMALPLLACAREQLPDVQLAYTFFSPSAERFAHETGADFVDYLPFDTTRAMRTALDALAPAAIVFSKLDVWPALVECAHARGIKTGLTSASIPERSKRHGLGARLTRDAYARLDRIGAASADDARRLTAAGAQEGRIRVTGDTRYDQAWARIHDTPRNIDVVDRLGRAHVNSPRATVVAGSTWTADTAQLLPAWETLVATARRETTPLPRLIVAPHEIRAEEIESLTRWGEQHQLRVARIDDMDVGDADVVIVDRVGILADLYAVATVAYVGGGFHDAGLHSVVEPAVCDVPTIVGPRHTQSRDAVLMRNAGGLFAVNDARECATTLARLSYDQAAHARASAAMHDVVSVELGATARSFEIVRELLGMV